MYGPVSRQVASALNELGNTAYWRGHLDDAEAHFGRMLEIYRTVYNHHHYLIGIALSNLANVSTQKKNYARAEQLFREALQAYAGTLPADHLNVGITNVKLGHALVSKKKYAEAEQHLVTGYQILTRQANPQVSYLRNARTDLVAAYEALNQPEKAERFRKELHSTQ